jgi:cell division protein FtsN
LKYDDGLLTKLLCEQENISEEQAKQIIEKFVREISDAMNNGNNFSIPNFGYFTKNNQGIIDFVIEDTDNNTYSETHKTNMPEENKEEQIFPPYFPPIAETTVFEKTEQTSQYDFNFPNSFIPPVNTTDTEKTTKSKTNHSGYWILTIVLIIIAVLFLLYLFSKDFKQTVNSLFSSKQKIEVNKDTTTIVADTAEKVKQEDTATTKQETANKQTAQTSTNTANGKYQVIAGCYLERSIAEDFADELIDKGYNARIPDRLAGEWNIVIVYESNDIDDAIRVKDSFVADGYSDTWVRTRAGNYTSSTVTAGQASSFSQTTNTTGTTRGRYQTIAGCYISRENAERYANELRSEGFDVRISDSLMGEWNILIICESNDFNEVNKVKEQCISAGYDAWIRTR